MHRTHGGGSAHTNAKPGRRIHRGCLSVVPHETGLARLQSTTRLRLLRGLLHRLLLVLWRQRLLLGMLLLLLLLLRRRRHVDGRSCRCRCHLTDQLRGHRGRHNRYRGVLPKLMQSLETGRQQGGLSCRKHIKLRLAATVGTHLSVATSLATTTATTTAPNTPTTAATSIALLVQLSSQRSRLSNEGLLLLRQVQLDLHLLHDFPEVLRARLVTRPPVTSAIAGPLSRRRHRVLALDRRSQRR